jgi:hypothetical protein
MSEPNFSTLYDVTIRKYKSTDQDSDEEEIQVLANSLREANELAEDYAEAVGQDGPYHFYDIVCINDIGTVFTGMTPDAVKDTEGAGVESGGTITGSNTVNEAIDQVVDQVQSEKWTWGWQAPYVTYTYPYFDDLKDYKVRFKEFSETGKEIQ